MCGKSPKAFTPPPPPKPAEPVAPIVGASEVDDDEMKRKKGIQSLKIESAASQSGTGLNIP